MSQSATLYRINEHEFTKLMTFKESDLFSLHDGYATFSGTHEGLRYILSKQCSEDEVRSIDELFYPRSFFERNPEEMWDEPSEEAILYHDPAGVQQIERLLQNMEDNQIEIAFDATDMNEKKIYPWFWSNEKSTEQRFNLQGLLKDFQRLKDFFLQASKKKQYVLSFVG